jgi:hypothetical protein
VEIILNVLTMLEVFHADVTMAIPEMVRTALVGDASSALFLSRTACLKSFTQDYLFLYIYRYRRMFPIY